MLKRLIVVVCALGISSSVSAGWQASAEFAEPGTRPHKLALLPPRAEMVKRKMVMTEELVAEAQHLEAVTRDAIAAHLRDLGYDVTVVERSTVNADPQLQQLVFKANTRYEEEWARIVRKPKRVRYGYYSAGDEARILAAALNVDGLVFTRVIASGAGGGQKALSMLLIGGGTTFTRLDAGIVDGDDGEVEAFYFARMETGYAEITKKAEKTMSKLTRKAMKRYPDVDETLKVKAPTDEEIAAIEEEDDDEVMEELEALLGDQAQAPDS
ncbi:MAG: hypothetical protein P8Y95_06255 [Gammaproteobacteria bacterium]|jgi:hypothetical protein